ncbi:hypothetical protein Cni_G29254 [Canna indica]|uniref:Endonuclease/exonuclease/phosphatase domain-containing protein n=1 Tax=Canna indica TaxID=4628 RepID=A0AAQ3L4I4_9LILI|nr:hypothetical protein Cni_G29254 [Canna indica]
MEENKPDMVLLVETHLNKENSIACIRKFSCNWTGCFVEGDGRSDGLVLVWRIEAKQVFCCNQIINAIILQKDKKPWLLSGVYASNKSEERQLLWEFLSKIDTENMPWVVIGDFNYIDKQEYKIGGNPFKWGQCISSYSNLCTSAGLMEVKTQGGTPRPKIHFGLQINDGISWEFTGGTLTTTLGGASKMQIRLPLSWGRQNLPLLPSCCKKLSFKAITCLAFSMDGVTLVSGLEDGFVQVWDTRTKHITRVLKHAKGAALWSQMQSRSKLVEENLREIHMEASCKPNTKTFVTSKNQKGSSNGSMNNEKIVCDPAACCSNSTANGRGTTPKPYWMDPSIQLNVPLVDKLRSICSTNLRIWWNNRERKRRISARLDKALVNWEWIEQYSDNKAIHLPRAALDHKRADMYKPHWKAKTSFIFEHYWFEQKSLEQVIDDGWKKKPASCSHLNWIGKNLSKMGSTITCWAKENIGSLEKELKVAKAELKLLDASDESGLCDDNDILKMKSLISK